MHVDGNNRCRVRTQSTGTEPEQSNPSFDNADIASEIGMPTVTRLCTVSTSASWFGVLQEVNMRQIVKAIGKVRTMSSSGW
jgi:hypothetical protein